jgi:hypothetical protein
VNKRAERSVLKSKQKKVNERHGKKQGKNNKNEAKFTPKVDNEETVHEDEDNQDTTPNKKALKPAKKSSKPSKKETSKTKLPIESEH